MEVLEGRNALMLSRKLERIPVNDTVEHQRKYQSAVLPHLKGVVRSDSTAVTNRTAMSSEELMCQ